MAPVRFGGETFGRYFAILTLKELMLLWMELRHHLREIAFNIFSMTQSQNVLCQNFVAEQSRRENVFAPKRLRDNDSRQKFVAEPSRLQNVGVKTS